MKEIIGYILLYPVWWYPDKKTQTTITTERINMKAKSKRNNRKIDDRTARMKKQWMKMPK